MFELLIYLTIGVLLAGIIWSWDGARDAFHPMMLIGPMLLFLYGWMPLKLLRANGLEGFFEIDQLIFVQIVNLLGVTAFVVGCLSVRCRGVAPEAARFRLSDATAKTLINGGVLLGTIGLGAWLVSIINVGGLRA
ncbi:MAG: hypothetical protein ACRD7E_14095, partial [Bryobacteraceae bacterium]